MNSNEIKNVESELWDAADDLRANSKLTAAEYKDPVLGLILLRFAENRYNETLKKIYDFGAKKKLCLEDSIINLIELDQFKPKIKKTFSVLIKLIEKWRNESKSMKL